VLEEVETHVYACFSGYALPVLLPQGVRPYNAAATQGSLPDDRLRCPQKMQKADDQAKTAAAKAARKVANAAGADAAAAASDTAAAPSAQPPGGTVTEGLVVAGAVSASDVAAAAPATKKRSGESSKAVVAVQVTATDVAVASSESDDTECQLVPLQPFAFHAAPKRSRGMDSAVGQPTRMSKRSKAP
jgi:hypothetical protein